MAEDSLRDGWVAVCCSDALCDGGEGARVELHLPGMRRAESAFAVRYEGQAHAYVNRCAHLPVELDWMQGHFFDDDARFLVCATHGAMYYPDTGACAGGPCAGKGLERLDCREADGRVWVRLPRLETSS